MSGLRETALTTARGAVLPVLSQERLFAIEHVAARLDRRPVGQSPYVPLRTCGVAEIDALSNGELRRVLVKVWSGVVPAGLPAAIVAAALKRECRSCDRAIIACYLSRLPEGHPDLPTLREAAGKAAERHAWRWRTIGREYRLWDSDGAARWRERGGTSASTGDIER